MRSHLVRLPILVCSMVLATHSQAALFDRGGGLIYDDTLNITWLQDANYSKTSGYDADGQMNWADAAAWADGLSYHDSVRNVTYTDWRLPKTFDIGGDGCVAFSLTGGTDCGYKPLPSTSEMATLYYEELGNKGQPDANYGVKSVGPFINLLDHEGYWSGTEHAPNPGTEAWAFGTANGHQDNHVKSIPLNAWAVRDGNVAAIPEPESYLLVLTGLVVIGALSRRRKVH